MNVPNFDEPLPDMACVETWKRIPPRMEVEIVSYKAGLGIFETNVCIQWIPIYKLFYQIRCCGNETNC